MSIIAISCAVAVPVQVWKSDMARHLLSDDLTPPLAVLQTPFRALLQPGQVYPCSGEEDGRKGQEARLLRRLPE